MTLRFLCLNLLFPASLVLLQSCGSSDTVRSDEISQNTVYQYYTASYDEDEGSITIKAQFRVGGSTGTTIELIEPSQVEHDQFSLQKTQSTLLGTFYRHTETSSFIETHEWTYTNNDNETYVNLATIQSIDFSDLSVNISQSEVLTLAWDGPAIGDDETIQAELRDSRNYLVLESTSQAGATTLSIPVASLQLLQQGVIQLRLVRMKTQTASQVTETGGRILTEYASQFRSANLDP